MRKLILAVIALVLSTGVNAELLVLESQRHHIGDDPTVSGWVPGEGLNYTILFELDQSSASDGILSYETYDVDSGFNSVVDTILLDGVQIAILESTTPEPGGANPLVFHQMVDTISAALLTAGVHELTFTSGPDFNGEFDDYMFQNVTLQYMSPDSDNDGISDSEDNCSLIANSDQRDTDGDGFGNRCDADFDQSCVTNFIDLGIMQAFFLVPGDFDTDLNGDGVTNFLDFSIFPSTFLQPPGPSGVTNDCDGM